MREILNLELACFPEEPYPRGLFEDLYRECGSLFLVAHRGRKLEAYMVSCAEGERAEIVSLAVAPAARRAGTASALMRRTLAGLRSGRVRRAFLMVRESNAAARAFYQRFGFRRARRVRHYYENREDGIRMILDL